MKPLTLRSLLTALIIFALANGVSLAQTSPGPDVTYKSSIEGLTINGEFDLVNQIVDFPPGSATSVHVHGGQGLALVLDGEITFRPEGKPEQVAKPGDVYVDTPGVPHMAANTGTGPARLSVVYALPKGATLTSPVGGTPTPNPSGASPNVTYKSTYPGITMQGEFTMVNQIVDFPPNSTTSLHVHGGPGIATVLNGMLVFRAEGKPDQMAMPGDVYLDTPGTPHRAVNQGSTPARLSFAVVVPKGAAVTTPLQQASPTAMPQPTATEVVMAQPTAAPAEQSEQPVGMPHTGSGPVDTLSVPLLLLVSSLLLVALGALTHYRPEGTRRSRR